MKNFKTLLSVALLTTFSPFGVLNAEGQEEPRGIEGYFEFNYGTDKKDAENWVQAIRVSEPELRSEISGTINVAFQAKGMTYATAYCWQQPESKAEDPWGKDVNVTPEGIPLDSEGRGSFEFPADEFPNGPINIRIHASNEAGKKDIFELQLFNTGGVKWNQGIPGSVPPAAKGLKLVFEDDFDGPLSISKDGIGTTYHAHKPGGGDFSGWKFTSPMGEGKPFEQKGTWLRIAARKDEESPKGRTGIIASVDKNFEGIWAKAPCYFECRFTAQSAIGTWAAFWTLGLGLNRQNDELDIVETYGGMGKGNPNHPSYSIVSHFWRQTNPDGSKKKSLHTRPDIMNLGGKSYWSTTFHTYAVYVGLEDTVYYFDDIEVFRHPTNNISKEFPHYFLVNYAIGGISGWPIDLSRYNEGSDMWVDYVRVYAKEPVRADYKPNFDPTPTLKTSGIGLNFSLEGDKSTVLSADRVTGASKVTQNNWNNLEGANGQISQIKDNEGKTLTGAKVRWKVTEGSATKAEQWGFRHAHHLLQAGALRGQGKFEITGIPYEKYDVYVYFSAGINTGGGSVTITSEGGGKVDPNGTYFYRIGWANGKFKTSDATSLKSAKNENTVVFKGNTADSIQLEWKDKLKGPHWTGVTGIQIVEVE